LLFNGVTKKMEEVAVALDVELLETSEARKNGQSKA